jgi:hypothetical protein
LGVEHSWYGDNQEHRHAGDKNEGNFQRVVHFWVVGSIRKRTGTATRMIINCKTNVLALAELIADIAGLVCLVTAKKKGSLV